MNKVGIVSIFDLNNIGNRLQNYALYKAIEALGYTPSVVENYPYPFYRHQDLRAVAQSTIRKQRVGNLNGILTSGRCRLKSVKRSIAALKNLAPSAVQPIPSALIRSVRHRDFFHLHRAFSQPHRVESLKDFTFRTMSVEPTVVRGPSDGQRLSDAYSAFVVGSDQVWNPRARLGCPTDFLTFAPAKKRIAYAASIGSEELKAPFDGLYSEMLSDFPSVSVRESRAAEIVLSATGRRPPIVLDPTLLLSPKHWSELADEATQSPSRNFVATYLLYRFDRETRARVTAGSGGSPVVDILLSGKTDEERMGVQSFLKLIRDANYLVTDSFHATVFSILFETPVRILSRGPGQDGRVLTLLRTLNVDANAAFGPADSVPTRPLVSNPEHVLAKSREASASWLSEALQQATA